MMNWISLSSVQFLKPQQGKESLMGICLYTSAAMKKFLEGQSKQQKHWLTVGEFCQYFQLLNVLYELVITGAFISIYSSPGIMKYSKLSHCALKRAGWLPRKTLQPKLQTNNCSWRDEQHSGNCNRDYMYVWPHSILKHGTVSWTQGRRSTALGRVCSMVLAWN